MADLCLRGVLCHNEYMKAHQFTAQIEKCPDTGFYVGSVPCMPGAHTQAKTLDELKNRLKEVVELCLEELTDEELDTLPEFVGFQQIQVAV
jgi:predicted RNase H-like HicB family nuclease